MDNKGITFLNRLYKDLHLSEEVMHSANKSDTKEEKVKKYLDRIEKAENLAKSNDRISLLKQLYYNKYVIKEKSLGRVYE